MRFVIVVIVVLALIVVGCTQTMPQTQPARAAPAQQGAQTAQPTGDAVGNIGTQIADANALNQDLSDADLDNLEKELNSVDW
jgi:uncharacterized protein YceK